MREVKIKGDTPEQKFEHLEVILRRMFRRLHKTVVGLIPASPIFGYCESPVKDPSILRAIFPADGIITHVALKSDKCSKKAKVFVDVVSGDEEVTKSFLLREKATVDKVDFLVHAGDTLEVWIEDSVEEDKASRGIWIGLLYQVGVKDLVSINLAVDQIEKLIGEPDVD